MFLSTEIMRTSRFISILGSFREKVMIAVLNKLVKIIFWNKLTKLWAFLITTSGACVQERVHLVFFFFCEACKIENKLTYNQLHTICVRWWVANFQPISFFQSPKPVMGTKIRSLHTYIIVVISCSVLLICNAHLYLPWKENAYLYFKNSSAT